MKRLAHLKAARALKQQLALDTGMRAVMQEPDGVYRSSDEEVDEVECCAEEVGESSRRELSRGYSRTYRERVRGIGRQATTLSAWLVHEEVSTEVAAAASAAEASALEEADC